MQMESLKSSFTQLLESRIQKGPHQEGNNKAVELLLKYLSNNQGGQSISDYVHIFP